MITAVEYLFLALLTLGTGLLSAYIVYLVVKPRAERLVSTYTNMVPARIKKELTAAFNEATENIDVGAIAGQLGGGEGGVGGLGDIAGMLGGGEGGLGQLLSLLTQFTGKKTTSKGGKMGL